MLLLLPFELLHCGMTLLADALARDCLPNSEPEDLDTQPKGPVIHVPHIEAEFLVSGQGITSVHLRPAKVKQNVG
jgi:hypothetical protein